MKIPIENIYYLLSYAWQYSSFCDLKKLQTDTYSNQTEMFVRIFEQVLSSYIKQGLKSDYIETEESLRVPRGKINLQGSFSHLASRSKQLNCNFDLYTSNNIINQTILATLNRCLKTDVKKELKSDLRHKIPYFAGADQIEFDQFPKFNRQFRGHQKLIFLLNLSEYIWNNIAFNENRGQRDFFGTSDLEKLHVIYEKFVLNFYRKHLPNKVHVSARKIEWDSDEENALFPEMRSDIFIEKENQIIVIDTKYYSEMFQYYRENKKFRSNNLYQIYTYISNVRSNGKEVKGILLYPTTHTEISSSRVVSNKTISIETINLNQPWQEIESRLYRIIEKSIAEVST